MDGARGVVSLLQQTVHNSTMVSSKSSNWRKVAIGFTFLVVNVVAKASFREIQVLKELERFNQETGATGGSADDRLSFDITAVKPFVAPATYAQTVDVCVFSYIFGELQLTLWGLAAGRPFREEE